MNFNDLFEASKLYRGENIGVFEKAYLISKNTNWNSLHTLSIEEIKNQILRFLNEFLCRLPYSDELAKNIKNTFEQLRPPLNALNNETLEDIDFTRIKDIGEERLRNGEIIRNIFDKFDHVGYRFRRVATSKLLHMVNPRLFVMWDNSIIRAYGLRPETASGSSYAFKFLPRMKGEVNEAILSYIDYRKCDRATAIKEIMDSCYGKTLAKLVDEYNYVKYTRKKL